MSQKNISLQFNFAIADVSFNAPIALAGNDVWTTEYSVAAAQPSTLTTRTDANTGELTMTNSGHGITTGAKVDLYWSGGCRRNMTVGTVAATVVPIDLGSGDDLPAADTVINASVPQVATFPMPYATVQLYAVQTDYESQFTFYQSNGTSEVHTDHLQPANNGQKACNFWYIGMTTNPFAANVAEVHMSHGDTAAAHVMSAGHMST